MYPHLILAAQLLLPVSASGVDLRSSPPSSAETAPGSEEGVLSGLVALITTRIPAWWDRFVSDEERQQAIRILKNLQKGFVAIQIECEALASSVKFQSAPFRASAEQANSLLDSIRELRKAVLEFGGSLGEQWKQEGQKLADALDQLTQRRVVSVETAMADLTGGNAQDAAKNLSQAGQQASDAHKTIREFILSLGNR